MQAMRVPSAVKTSVVPALRLQRRCACGMSLARPGAAHGGCGCGQAPGLQPRLAIGRGGDPLEREADRAAEQVMRMDGGAQAPSRTQAPLLSRHPADSTGTGAAAPDSVHRTLQSAGQPLPAPLRDFFEPRFGHDFSRVRIHVGVAAAESARDVHASAYTVGRHIVFGSGQFVPGSDPGRRLLAHELTHVLQQSGADGASAEPGRGAAGIVRAQALPGAEAVPAEDPGVPALETTGMTPLDTGVGEAGSAPGPDCSRGRNQGQELPLARAAFVGEHGFASLPADGYPGSGGVLVRNGAVQIKVVARWVEQIPDPAQRPPGQGNRSPTRPQYYLRFSGWADACGAASGGSPASTVQSGNLSIGTEHTVPLTSLRPGRYGLEIIPSTAAAERNRVLSGECEIT